MAFKECKQLRLSQPLLLGLYLCKHLIVIFLHLPLLMLFFWVFSCQNQTLTSESESLRAKKTVDTTKNMLSKYDGQQKISINKQISIGDYKLKIYTVFWNDTLDVIDWAEDQYSRPIIQTQELHFYRGKKKIKSYQFPIKKVHKKTINNELVDGTTIPIHEICLLQGKSDIFYFVYGADFCNGIECPEFIGIYNKSGNAIFENITTNTKIAKIYGKWSDISKKYGLNYNQKHQCVQVHDFWP